MINLDLGDIVMIISEPETKRAGEAGLIVRYSPI